MRLISPGRLGRVFLRAIPARSRGRVARALLAVVPRNRRGNLALQLLPVLGQFDHLAIIDGRLAGWAWIPGSSVPTCLLGTFSPENQRVFADHVRRGDAVWDVGANVGFFTLLAADLVGLDGRVTAIEPLPLAQDYLNRHVRLNRLSNVDVKPVAVGSERAVAGFEPATWNLTMGRLEPGGALQVDVVVLDEIEGRKPAFVKIDIEGGEVAALEGARTLLRDSRPILLLATHGAANDRECRQILEEYNYSVTTILDEGGLDESLRAELLAKPRPSFGDESAAAS